MSKVSVISKFVEDKFFQFLWSAPPPMAEMQAPPPMRCPPQMQAPPPMVEMQATTCGNAVTGSPTPDFLEWEGYCEKVNRPFYG
jgi:hypothetical protein